MAVQTITVDTNVDDIASFRSNDSLTINNGAVVTVNTDQKKLWNAVTINNGKLRIENTSTSTAIRYLGGRASGTTLTVITPASGLGTIEILGNWIEIGTGTGASGQTFTVPYSDHVSMIEVETASGSGVYEMWTNCLGAFWPAPVSAREGFSGFGSGRKGMVFRQIPEADPLFRPVLTNSTTTNASRVITVSSTARISNGSRISGTNIPANTIVEAILSATQLETNANCTGTSSAVTVTVYPTYTSQLTNQIEVGNGVNGAVIPSGCKVRIPNILVTGVWGVDIGSGQNGGMQINMVNGGRLIAEKCLFDNITVAMNQPQTLILRNVGFTAAQAITKAYGIELDGVAIGVYPKRQYITSNRFYYLHSYTSNIFTVSYVTGTINNVVLQPDRWLFSGSSTNGDGLLAMQYADGMTISNIRGGVTHLDQQYAGLVGLLNSNRCTITNLEACAIAPLRMYSSSDNTLDGVLVAPHRLGSVISSRYNSAVVLKYGLDPATGNILTANTPYYFKARYHADFRLSDNYAETNEYCVVPHLSDVNGGWASLEVFPGNNFVRLSWSQNYPWHTSPAYEIFRSSVDPLVVTRDVGTRIFTTNTQTTVTTNDNTAVNGTTYYYVFRKYTSAGVFQDSPVIKATPRLAPVYRNYLFYSNNHNVANWVKVNCTVNSSGDSASMFTGVLNHGASLRRITVNAANATATNTVTGLTIGVVYTAHVWTRLERTGTGITTTGMRLTFGTAFTDFSVTEDWTRTHVTFTATATSHTFVLRFDTTGIPVMVGNCQVSDTASPYVDIGTSATLVTAAYELTSVVMQTRSLAGADASPIHGGFSISTPTILGGFQDYTLHLSDTSGFTPSDANLIDLYGGAAASVAAFQFYTGSSRNAVKNITAVGRGNPGSRRFALFTASSSDNVVRDGSVSLGFSISGTNNAAIQVDGDTNRNKIANIEFSGLNPYQTNYLLYSTNTANGTVLENIRHPDAYNHAALMYNNASIVRGMSGGAASNLNGTGTTWALGSGFDGTPTTMTAIYDTHFMEMYHGATVGALNILFTASTSASPPYTLTGLAAFSNTGLLYLQAAGDSVTYTWPHKIFGVTGFRNIRPKNFQTDMGVSVDTFEAMLLEYQIDTGSGYTAWSEATAANLSAITGIDEVVGFGLKLRITARPFFKYITETNAFVVGEVVRAVTGGGTATVDAVYDLGTSGTVTLSGVAGTWSPGTLVVRNSDSQSRATISSTNGFALGPSFTSLIRGLEIYTNVDQTVLYPSESITLTLTGLVAGSDITVLGAGTETIRLNTEDHGGTTLAYVYTDPGTVVDITVYKSGHIPAYVRNYTLGASASSLPISQTIDPSYLE